jgi:DNA-directed RNA polymerase specialized sigma24 family protein
MLRSLLFRLRSRSGFVCTVIVISIVGVGTAAAANVTPQVVTPVVAIVDRLSWGAVIAGAILGLVLQFALHTLGISLGFAGVNPTSESDLGDELRDMTKETLIWMGGSMLIALFIAGWVAGRFAGVPEQLDGLLHGLLVWALVMLVSMLLLMTSLGRIISGMTNLIGRGFNLMGQVAKTTAQGAANVAGAAARGTADVVQTAADQAGDAARRVSQNMPATNGTPNAKVTYDQIMVEARNMMRESGISPEQMEQEVEAVKTDVQQGVERVMQDPAQAEAVLQETLTNVFKHGRAVANSVDRDKVVNLLASRTNMSEAEARRTVTMWEERLEQARQQIGQDAQHTRVQAEMKAEEIRDDIEDRVDTLRDNAEATVIDVAKQTSDTLATFAGAIFAAMVVSGLAAAIGGVLGAP